MTTPRYFPTIIALLALLSACTRDPTTTPEPSAHPLSDTLAAVVADYEALRLPEALARARRLRVMVDTAGPEMPKPLRAEVFQYLALLHYHSTPHFDSTSHYATAAAEALPTDAPTDILARQMLTKASASLYAQNWIEVDLLCKHGDNLLRSAGRDNAVLRGELLILQAKARKQQGDQDKRNGCKHEACNAYWGEADSLLRRAETLLQAMGSPWAVTASAERIILATRSFGGTSPPDAMIRELSNTYGKAPRDVDRLWAYVYHRAGMRDSATYYYQRVLQNATEYSAWDLQEASYILLTDATTKGRYADAITTALVSMQAANCCPAGTMADVSDIPLHCLERSVCIAYHALLCGIYYQRYLNDGVALDLKRADALARSSVNHYSATFGSLKEEGALNRILVQGQRLLDASLRTATRHATLYPTAENLDFVFKTMEVGRNLLLLQDIAEARDSVRDASLLRLDGEINLLKLAHARDRDLSASEVARFVKLIAAYERSAAQLRVDVDALGATTEFDVPPLSSVRASLRRGQALIEFSQTDTELFAIYIDSARTNLYRISDSLRFTIEDYQKALHHGQDPERYDSLAHLIFQGLLGPVQNALLGQQELLIVPSPLLQDLSFSALTVSRSPASRDFVSLDYLVDHFTVRYLESWRVKEQLEHPGRPISATGPVAGVWTNPSLEHYLGGLGDTLLAFSDSGSDHYRGRAVNKGTLLSNAGRYDLLHLSVHARGNAAVLYDNYLILNPSDSLNGVRIGGLTLTADLVVLAACSTAGGYTGRGEGTFSLRRSFHIAGAPFVVSSFFDISATTTSGILQRFYRYHLVEGNDPALALARAVRDCRAGRLNRRWTRPVYWAGLLVG